MATMKAIMTVGDGRIELREIAVPKPGRGEMLVKVAAAAQNPTDWKSVKLRPAKDTIVGCDFAGIVEALGPDVDPSERFVGERVAGFVHGAAKHTGSFAEYVLAKARVAIHIPDAWSFEDAAGLGVAAYTACQMLYESLEVPTPFAPPSPADERRDILVWGGATSVGMVLIQFAKLAGLRVIATASSKNFELLKSLGADAVFDYRDPETPQKIKDLTGGRLKSTADCVAEGTTGEQISAAMGPDGVIANVLSYKGTPPSATTRFTVAYCLLGDAFGTHTKFDADPAAYQRGIAYSKHISDILASGKFKPQPVKLMPAGLASVQDGFDYMQEGKVSGEKITYRISDTP